MPVAVVELDAMRGGAAEKCGVEQVGAPRTARHRNLAGRTHRRDHRLGARRDIAGRARNHHADGVEQMPARIVAHLFGQRVVAQPVDELTIACVAPAAGCSV